MQWIPYLIIINRYLKSNIAKIQTTFYHLYPITLIQVVMKSDLIILSVLKTLQCLCSWLTAKAQVLPMTSKALPHMTLCCLWDNSSLTPLPPASPFSHNGLLALFFRQPAGLCNCCSLTRMFFPRSTDSFPYLLISNKTVPETLFKSKSLWLQIRFYPLNSTASQ